MSLKVHSIRFKLLSIGLLSVLLPLLVVGFFSVTKSSTALMSLSHEKVQTMATDLGLLVNNLLHAETIKVEMLAVDQLVVKSLVKRLEDLPESRAEHTRNLFEALGRKFQTLNAAQQYQGLFVADASGQILTGVLAGGSEYTKVMVSENSEFKKAKDSGDTVIGEMIRSQATSQLVVPVVAPIFSEKKHFLGIVGLVLKADYFTQLVAKRKVGETGVAIEIQQVHH